MTLNSKISFERSALAAFADQVGQMGYGSSWTGRPELTKEGHLRSGFSNYRKLYEDVFHQISLALGHGLAEAEVVIALPEIKAKQGVEDLYKIDSSDSDSDISDTETSNRTEHFVLKPSFWRGDWKSSILEWQSSTLMIQLDSLRISESSPFGGSQPRTRSLFKAHPELKEHRRLIRAGQVYIKRSEIALGYINGDLSPFSGIKNDRYKGLDNRFLDELIAVAWREIAINLAKQTQTALKPKSFRRSIEDYIEHLDLDPDMNGVRDSTIGALCTKLHAQFRNVETKTQPFVNSTPKRSKYREGAKKPK